MAKNQRPQSRPAQPPPPAPPSGRRVPPLLIAAPIAVLIGLGVVLYLTRSQAAPGQQAAAPAPVEATAETAKPVEPAGTPVTAKFGPHKQENLPPLPFGAYPPARPVEVVKAAYEFAAEHPEVLSYVPCYCGCENNGHRGNDDCFVKSRAENGDVLEWEPHGVVCQVCIDVARDAMQMYASGASLTDIRAANEKKWAGQFQNKTPTPLPPGDPHKH